MADSVTLEELVGPEAAGGAAPSGMAPRLGLGNIKLIFSLFMWFLVVVSDVFTNSIIAGFGSSAVKGRTPTSWGVVLQGTFLVLGYMLLVYLTEHEVL